MEDVAHVDAIYIKLIKNEMTIGDANEERVKALAQRKIDWENTSSELDGRLRAMHDSEIQGRRQRAAAMMPLLMQQQQNQQFQQQMLYQQQMQNIMNYNEYNNYNNFMVLKNSIDLIKNSY
jgi:hypothetical protein